MRVEKLEMKNFRGFEELTIEFPNEENGSVVFVGVNGAGKTSVLEDTVLMLYAFYLKIFDFESGIYITERDIKNGKTFTKNSLMLKFDNEIFSIKSNIQNSFDVFQALPSIDISPKGLKELRDAFKLNISFDIPLFVYYPTNRLVPDFPSIKAKNISRQNRSDAFMNAFSSTISFQDFFIWFRNTEDFENEVRLQENPQHRNIGLEVVRKAIEIFLISFKNPRVKRQPKEAFVVEKDGEELSISNLSHGEKAMIAMIGDLARRLSMANPMLENPLEGKGVILIDEIELHLHPKWQRSIFQNLRKTFPNIQFILTTHSPQVLSNMKRENVFILEDFKLVKNTPHTFGKDSNSILYDLFGVPERPEHAKKEFKKLYRLIDNVNKVEEAKKEYQKMKEKYGEFDPEIVRAGMHLSFLTE